MNSLQKYDKSDVKQKLSILNSAILSDLNWKEHLIKRAKNYYLCTEERCAISIIIDYDNVDNVHRKIKKCNEILSKYNINDETKSKLLELALPEIIYYDIEDIHLKCNKKIEQYIDYNTENSCIIIIGIPAFELNYYYHSTEFIQL